PKGKGTAVPSVSTSTRTTRSMAQASSAQPSTRYRSTLPQPISKAPSTARKAPPAAQPALKPVTLESTFKRNGIEEEVEEEITPKPKCWVNLPASPGYIEHHRGFLPLPRDGFTVNVVGAWYFEPNIGDKTSIVKFEHISKLFEGLVCRECGDVFDKDHKVSKDSLPTLVVAHLIGCPPNHLVQGDQLYQYKYAISDIPASVSELIASCSKAEDGDLIKQVVEKVVSSGGGMSGSREGKELNQRHERHEQEAVKRIGESAQSKGPSPFRLSNHTGIRKLRTTPSGPTVILSRAQSESGTFSRAHDSLANV
ncbi:hypothetical protein P7C70_g9159, partial [Phenoliferia sp. Uapishka_3]